MKQYFTWTFDYNVNDANSRYGIDNNFFRKYPHLEGIVTLVAYAVPDDKVKEFAPGKQWNYRLGYVEADDSVLANFATSLSDIVAKAKLSYSYHEPEAVTPEQALAWVRKWGDLEEVSDGKFLVSEGGTNPMNGETVEAKYLVIE